MDSIKSTLIKAVELGITPADNVLEEEFIQLISSIKSISDHEALKAVQKMYGFNPGWVEIVFHQSYGNISPAYVEFNPKDPYKTCQIHLFKRFSMLTFGISDREILEHEYAHIGRLSLDSNYDEYFAYLISNKTWKKWVSLAFDNQWFIGIFFLWMTCIPFLVASLQTPLSLYAWILNGSLSISAVSLLACSIYRVRKIEKALSFITSFMDSSSRALQIIYRMKDEEINRLSKADNQAMYWFKEKISNPDSLRWQQIALIFKNKHLKKDR